MTHIILTCLCLMAAQPQPEMNPVDASLISERSGLEPGTTATIALELDLRPGWHVYWNGQNDSGMPPALKWTAPDTVKVGPIQWPAPRRYTSPGDIVDHIYEGRVTLLVPVTVAKDAPIGSTVDLSAEASWMVCDEMCLLGGDSLEISLPVQEKPAPTKNAAQIAEARALLPNKTVPDDVSMHWEDDVLKLSLPGASSMSFYPGHASVDLASLLDDGHADGSTLTLRIAGGGVVSGVIDAVMPDGRRIVFELKEPTPS